MNKFFTTFLTTLLPILGMSQNTIDAQLFDIGKKGNSEMKNLRISDNQLFFTGIEFYNPNFARYNFDTNKFTTFNTNKYNYNLNYENILYAIINNEVFYIFKENNYVEIKKGLENGTVETFFETPTQISNFKQFGKDKFIFSSVHYKTQNTTFERLWISDGTKEGTKIIYENNTPYSNINFIDNIEGNFYFTSGNTIYSVDSNTNEIIKYFTALSNPLFVFKNKIHFFKYNYQTKEQELYVINSENSSEKVASILNDNIGNDFNYYIVGDNVYIYTNVNSTFYVDSYLYEYNSKEQTIKKIIDTPVREIQNIFDYNGKFYFSTYTEDSKYFNYKIEDDTILEMNYFVKDNTIYNPIIYEDKLFVGNDGKISYYDFLTKELIDLNNEFYQSVYYTYFKNPFIYKNELYFVGSDELNDEELFKYNKDKNIKEVVFNYNSSQRSSPNGFHKNNDNILFFANNNLLYKFNPINNNYNIILDKDQNQIRGIFPEMTANFDNKKIIFSTNNFELGFSDGTSDGTYIYEKRDSNENFLRFYTSNLIPLNNKIIFNGSTKNQGQEPWVTDGTKEGTFMLKDILSGSESSIYYLTENGLLNNKLYFTATSYGTGNSYAIYETDGTKNGTKKVTDEVYGENYSILGNYKNYLIIYKSILGSYSTYLYLFDPITSEQIELDKDYSPDFYFEFENKLYCSEYNSFYYFDENYKKIFLKNEQSTGLKKIGIIDDTMYLYSNYNGFIYKLKQNKLELYQEEYLTKKEFKQNKDYIYYIQNHIINDQYQGYNLQIINKNGLKKFKINFQGENNDTSFIDEFKIIDNKLYLSKENKRYGQELYIIDLPKDLLASNEINQEIKVKSYYTIYPNPSSDYFKVRTKNNDNLSITIFDINGTKIRNVNVKSESEIKINNLPKGIYIIHIDNGIQKENKKLIIK